jgi:hypothetical protein
MESRTHTMTEALDLDHLRNWVGRTETHEDLLSHWTPGRRFTFR